VVLIPAGTYTWTRAVKLGTVSWGKAGPTTTGQKHLTLQGAGIDRTILVDEVPPDPRGQSDSMFIIHTLEGKPFRITGMTLRGGTGEVGELCALRVLGTGKQVRTDHVKFHHLKTRGLYVNGEVFGVIDHCEFLINAWKQAIWIGHSSWGGHDYGDGSWASPLSLGTEKAVYIEDNVFRSEGPATAAATVDSWMGGRWVFRHNRVENMTIGNHGTESSGRWRGCFSMEIYDNVFHRPVCVEHRRWIQDHEGPGLPGRHRPIDGAPAFGRQPAASPPMARAGAGALVCVEQHPEREDAGIRSRSILIQEGRE